MPLLSNFSCKSSGTFWPLYVSIKEIAEDLLAMSLTNILIKNYHSPLAGHHDQQVLPTF